MPKRSFTRQLWASFRLSIVGVLLAAPPPRGQLEAELRKLAEREWRHPITHQPRRYAYSTIEQWYYLARLEGANPIDVLGRKIREDSGRFKSICADLRKAIRELHRDHRGWSHQLHYDNLVVLAEKNPKLGRVPSYCTILRFRNAHRMFRERVPGPVDQPGVLRAIERKETREIRGFEADYVHGLWHCDGHKGHRKVLRCDGEWVIPVLIAFMDDRSRLVCHAQWYWVESAENVVHGLQQALLKRGLCRALMRDNGGAMIAAEVAQSLERLSIQDDRTLAYSAYQNAKLEHFWDVVEGRLIPQLEGVRDLTLGFLNKATQAFVEHDYHHRVNEETGQTPLARFVAGPDVGRPCPSQEDLRKLFGAQKARTVRRSDGTVSIEKTRYEIPWRFRHLKKVTVRYCDWDLSSVHLVDDRTNRVVDRIFPRDLSKNADGRRRLAAPIAQPDADTIGTPRQTGPSPLLQKQMEDYAATGLPPGYIPKDEIEEDYR